MANSFQSFSRRLSRRIILIVLVMMVLMGVGMVTWTMRLLENLTESHYQVVMEDANQALEKELRAIEVAALNDAAEVERHLSSPQDVFETLVRNLRQNTGVYSYFAGFEPYFFPKEGQWFCANIVWQGNCIKQERVGSPEQDYQAREWYQKGLQTKDGYWSQPYFAVSDPKLRLCSFIVPLHDKEGRAVGVFGADLDLSRLHKWLAVKDIGMNKKGITKIGRENRNEKDLWSYSFIVSRKGELFAHPDSSRILRDNLFLQFEEVQDTACQRMIGDIKSGLAGKAKIRVGGTPIEVFYAPLEHTDWMMGVVVPLWVQQSVGVQASLVLGAIILVGLLLVYLTIRLTIRRTTSPLHALADSVEEVAKGNFEVPLPEMHYNDELKMLRDTFGDMQQSLGRYMEDLKASTAANAAIENELDIARSIQMAMIPMTFPPYPDRKDIDVYGVMEPAKSVGGDLFDFLMREERLFFCIGDVSGKGVPAALVMAVIRSLFRSIAAEETNPQRIVARINATMCDGNDTAMFATMFVGVLDLQTGRLDFCNAGHERPLLFAQEVSQIVTKPLLPVGVLAELDYEVRTVMLAPGTTLLLYTDGLTEAAVASGQLFGTERILAVARKICAGRQCEARQVIEAMRKAVGAFVGGASQSDDLTMLAVRYNGNI